MRRLLRLAWPALVQAVVVLIVLAVVFHDRFDGDFVWDDDYYVLRNDVLTHGSLRDFLTPAMYGRIAPVHQVYRPTSMLSLWFQTWMSGLSLPAFRTGDLLIHAANSALLLGWLRRQKVSPWIAVMASVAFAVHPSTCELVMWVMARGDLLATFFALAALVVWRATPGRAALAALFAGLAFLSKESFVFAPVFLALNHAHERWRDGKQPLDRGMFLVLPAVFAELGIVLFRTASGISTATSSFDFGFVNLLRIGATIVAHYTRQLLGWSNGATVQDFRVMRDPVVVLTWLVLLGAVALLTRGARRRSFAAAGMLLGVSTFSVALAPLALALPVTGTFGNRYAYFPLVAVFVVLAHAAMPIAAMVARRAPRLVPVLTGALVVAIGLSGLSTSVEAMPWHDAVTLFAYDEARSPNDPKALYHYAVAVGAANGCETAMQYYERAVAADPSYTRAWHNLTGCLVNEKRYADAVIAGERALALSAGAPRDEYNLGVALSGAGRRGAAIAHLDRAVTLDPSYAPARAALAKARAAP